MMNLEELLVSWKKQDSYVEEYVKTETLHLLLKVKSKNALNHIRNRLVKELLVILLIIIVSDALFIIVPAPITPLRWSCFAILNLIAGLYIFCYQNAIRKCRLEYDENMEQNLHRIVQSLTRFPHIYQLSNIPVFLLCFLMFAGAQNLIILLPWMLLEFFILRWVMLPKLTSRFGDYKAELEYSLKQFRETEGNGN